MCIFKTKDDIEELLKDIKSFSIKHDTKVSDYTFGLLRIISLYLLYEVQEEDRSEIAIMKLLNCCKPTFSPSTFEIMITAPRVNKEPLHLYVDLRSQIGSSSSESFFQTIERSKKIMTLYISQNSRHRLESDTGTGDLQEHRLFEEQGVKI